MRELLQQHRRAYLVPRGDAFYTLLRAIAGQQISVKAADAVWSRVQQRVQPLTPESLLRRRESTLRAAGFSAAKVQYARNLAQFFVAMQRSGVASDTFWATRSDDEIMAELTAIKGIGRWTAEMFLMFHLGRPDVLPLQDLGLIKAIDRYYPAATRRTRRDYEAVALPWRPYRSVATWFLWRALDPVPVSY